MILLGQQIKKLRNNYKLTFTSYKSYDIILNYKYLREITHVQYHKNH